MAAALLRRNPRILIPRASLCTLSSPNADNITAVKSAVRSESDPDRLADLFVSAAHIPAFHGDRLLYNLSIKKLARRRRFDLIERVLDHHLSSPQPEGFLVRIISLYSSAGMLDHAVRTFDQAIPAVRCTQRSLSALLTAYLENRQLPRLFEAFDRVPKDLGITPGIIPYNILINAHCVSGDLEAARNLLNEMPKRGVKPDIVSYNTLLSAYLKKGDESGFDEILEEIRAKELKPNIATYDCRISALCGKGKSSEAVELLDAMPSVEIKPSRTTFNTLIAGLCKQEDIVSAMRIFERMGKETAAEPNSETYITLLRGLVDKGEFSSALGMCKKCLRKKWAPPFEVVKGLIDGLVRESRIDDAKGVVRRMKRAVSGNAADAWKKLEDSFAFEMVKA